MSACATAHIEIRYLMQLRLLRMQALLVLQRNGRLLGQLGLVLGSHPLKDLHVQCLCLGGNQTPCG